MTSRGLRLSPAELRMHEARRAGHRLANEGAQVGTRPNPAVELLWDSLQQMIEPRWEREYEFHPLRRWRFDFACPALRIAVEVDGAVHRIRERFDGDLDKGNQALLEDWHVLHVSPEMVSSDLAIALVLELIRKRRRSNYDELLACGDALHAYLSSLDEQTLFTLGIDRAPLEELVAWKRARGDKS